MFTYETVNGKIVKRKAKKVVCLCGKEWLIRADRNHSGLCRSCGFKKELNPRFGKEAHNKGIWTFNRKEYSKVYNKNKRHENKLKAVEMLGAKCQHCSIENIHPSCWDFHHVDKKESSISQLLNLSWKQIKKELESCILLCVCCHRILHSQYE